MKYAQSGALLAFDLSLELFSFSEKTRQNLLLAENPAMEAQFRRVSKL
jgi:hypothetical protein